MSEALGSVFPVAWAAATPAVVIRAAVIQGRIQAAVIRGGGSPGGTNGGNTNYDTPPDLKVRWESAQPIRAAELKARETNAPAIDESHYAIAVYGVPTGCSAGMRRPSPTT